MRKEVFFYFDPFKNNGIGHYSRCSALNIQLKKKGIKTFLILLNKKKINYFKEFKTFKFENLINEKKKKLLIIDDYNISSRNILHLKRYFKSICLVEDIPSNKKNIDIIINPNYGVKRINYNHKENIKFFLGVAYKLIRVIKRYKNNKNGLLISFGGGKVFNRIRPTLTLILKHLKKSNYKKKIILFINLTKTQINYFEQFKSLNLNIKKIGPIYQDELLKSEFCISSLGVQHDEIIKKKIPAIFFKIDKNQNYNFKISKKINNNFTFNINHINEKKLLYALDKINKRKYRDQIIKNYSKIKLGEKVFQIIKFIQKKLYEKE